MDTQQIAETLVNQFNAGEEKKIYEVFKGQAYLNQ